MPPSALGAYTGLASRPAGVWAQKGGVGLALSSASPAPQQQQGGISQKDARSASFLGLVAHLEQIEPSKDSTSASDEAAFWGRSHQRAPPSSRDALPPPVAARSPLLHAPTRAYYEEHVRSLSPASRGGGADDQHTAALAISMTAVGSAGVQRRRAQADNAASSSGAAATNRAWHDHATDRGAPPNGLDGHALDVGTMGERGRAGAEGRFAEGSSRGGVPSVADTKSGFVRLGRTGAEAMRLPAAIEALRRMAFDDAGARVDLLKTAQNTRTTLGLHIGLNSGINDLSPTQVQSVIPGACPLATSLHARWARRGHSLASLCLVVGWSDERREGASSAVLGVRIEGSG